MDTVSAQRGIRNTSTENMWFVPDLPTVRTRQNVEQFNAYFSAAEIAHRSLHTASNDIKGSTLRHGQSWMGQADVLGSYIYAI